MKERLSQPVEIRIAGFGGQGVVLAGVLLGRAALSDGMHALQTQSYGAEARGGAARSEVIVSPEPIVYPEVIAPHLMVAMSQAALDRYLADLRRDGRLILDSELVRRIPDRPGSSLLSAPFTQIAGREFGRPIVANMVMLGFLGAATRLVSEESLRQSVLQGVPEGTEELNLKALSRGMELGADAKEAASDAVVI